MDAAPNGPKDDAAFPVRRVLAHVIVWLAPVLVVLSLAVESRMLWQVTLVYSAFIVGAVILLSAYPYSIKRIRTWGWYGLVWFGVYVMTTILVVQLLFAAAATIGKMMGLW